MSEKRADTNDEALHRPVDAAQAAILAEAWVRPAGLTGWLSSTDHKEIGRRFIVTAFAFFLLGGLLAATMRLQLSRPEAGVIGPDLYNQVFTMHGTTMMFLFAVPVMQAMGLYLVPLMIGARNLAFPRLPAFGYFVCTSSITDEDRERARWLGATEYFVKDASFANVASRVRAMVLG